MSDSAYVQVPPWHHMLGTASPHPQGCLPAQLAGRGTSHGMPCRTKTNTCTYHLHLASTSSSWHLAQHATCPGCWLVDWNPDLPCCACLPLVNLPDCKNTACPTCCRAHHTAASHCHLCCRSPCKLRRRCLSRPPPRHCPGRAQESPRVLAPLSTSAQSEGTGANSRISVSGNDSARHDGGAGRQHVHAGRLMRSTQG
jgi:hypothetical protein